jgi:hypothetical protein
MRARRNLKRLWKVIISNKCFITINKEDLTMKTLLTSKEMFANCKNVYNEDFTAFHTEGEPRGKMK